MDRQMLDRREAVEEWMEASRSLQQCYVDWMIRSTRVLFPQLPNHIGGGNPDSNGGGSGQGQND
jgi:hypothetical protein